MPCPLSPYLPKRLKSYLLRNRPPGFSITVLYQGATLAGVAVPLSAARLSRVAAAVAEAPNLQPVIPEKQVDLGGPGKRGVEVGEKIPEIGLVPMHRFPQLSLLIMEDRAPSHP
jgi:hypothetical protein